MMKLAEKTAGLLGRFAALLYPEHCEVCGAFSEGCRVPFVCDACADELPLLREDCCPRCGMPGGPYTDFHGGKYCSACRNLRFRFRGACAAAEFRGGIRSLVLGLKFARKAYLYKTLGLLLAERIRACYPQLPFALVLPVPLHVSRLRERGYDQAELIARETARRLSLPVNTDTLVRVHATPPLAKMSRTARQQSARGIFTARPSDALNGKTVLIVDDVMTTGATASDATRALRDEAGVREVYLAVLARTI